jgi:hypothetical protein
VRALVKNGSYHIKAITRNPESEKAKKLVGLEKVTIVKADLDDPKSVEESLIDCYGVFLVTDFAAHLNNTEVQHGKTVIDMAIKTGLKHVVFSGLENVKSIIHKSCLHFDNKAEIEDYGLQNGDKINFTSVRLPCYFENFGGSIFAYKLSLNNYLINVPIADERMYGMSVDDTGECVASVFQNPEDYKSKLIGLSGDYLKLNDYVEIMNKHLAPNNFTNSKMTIEKFSSFQFPGVEDLAAMFEYYQTGKMNRDIELSKRLNKDLLSFEGWIVKNKEILISQFQ